MADNVPGVPAPDDLYKAAALQAIAQGGSKAKASLDATKASMEASRTAAVSQALQEGARLNVSQAGQDQLSNTITKPYTAAEGALQTRFDPRITQAAARQDPTARLFDAKYQLNLPKPSGRGGGGGGSGRSSSSDWFSPIKDSLGIDTKANAKSYFSQQGGVSTQARQLAQQAGVPANIASAWYPKTKTETQTEQWLQQNVQNRAPNKPVFSALAQQYGKGSPAYQYYTQLYQQTPYPTKKGK